MKIRWLLIAVLLLSACGGRKMNNTLARDLIVGAHQESLKTSDVDIVNVSQSSKTDAVIETRLRMAFRLEKAGNRWILREARPGHGQWENVEHLERALNQIKSEETENMLRRILDAIGKYQETHKRIPEFKDFIDLTDQLSPKFLTPLIRLDAWQRPIEASLSDTEVILLRSAGPDGIMGTTDDITASSSPRKPIL